MSSVQTIVTQPAVRQGGHGRNTPSTECNIDATAEVKQIVQKVLLSSQKRRRRSVLARLSSKLPRKKRHAGPASEAPTPPGSVGSDSVVIATEDMNPETLSLPPTSASLSSSPSNNGQTKEASKEAKEAEKGQPETKGWLYKWTNYIKVCLFSLSCDLSSAKLDFPLF